MAPKEVRDRQRFDLAPAGGDQQAEVDRLISLGATRLEVDEDGAVVLADPDGNEFCVRGTSPQRVSTRTIWTYAPSTHGSLAGPTGSVDVIDEQCSEQDPSG